MRKENGEMIENAHLLGMFRRICKLLYFNVKPVFVFDGPAPSLKRQTLKQRRYVCFPAWCCLTSHDLIILAQNKQ